MAGQLLRAGAPEGDGDDNDHEQQREAQRQVPFQSAMAIKGCHDQLIDPRRAVVKR